MVYFSKAKGKHKNAIIDVRCSIV